MRGGRTGTVAMVMHTITDAPSTPLGTATTYHADELPLPWHVRHVSPYLALSDHSLTTLAHRRLNGPMRQMPRAAAQRVPPPQSVKRGSMPQQRRARRVTATSRPVWDLLNTSLERHAVHMAPCHRYQAHQLLCLPPRRRPRDRPILCGS